MQTVAKQFEAVFARQMIGSMRQADLAEGVFDSSATGQFRDMADSRTADSMADAGGLGIAQMLMRQYDAGHAAQAKIAPPAKAVTGPAVDSSE
ncbi:flagellar biosynthesis protein FlgI [Sphingomonas solaris]|uniref:Flagellar biosynthesis protein FlgI n=2 Tax=Alterirhizorhabdus solaris TaxID=2529389 RepID=A0A558QUZ6_9SPHN|nr:flagellar biosynthesis protein FlgI [Sphingomonas solaris]